MPVKIVATPSDDQREITLQEYLDGRQNFDDHYFVLDNEEQTESFSGQDFYIPWADLQNAVSNYCNQYSINQQDVGVRLVHCYNTVQDTLYMRMQLCTLQAPFMNTGPAKNLEANEFILITTETAWYTIEQGMIQVTADDQLHDTPYLDNFYYTELQGSTPYVQLSQEPDVFVRNFVYPWYTEILAMYEGNDSPMNAMIHFAACSYTESPEAANVPWPHGNVLYLSVNDVPLLNNDEYIVIFKYKGADNATLCPPKCNVYVPPVNN